MKTIKELEATTINEPRYIEDLEYLQALKDVLKLIDKVNNEVHIHRLMELKKRIEG